MVTSTLLKTYSFGQLQDFLTLHDRLAAGGKTVEDLRAYVGAKKKAMVKGGEIAGVVLTRQCPECGQRLAFARVNTGPRNQTGDDSTFVWTCPACGHEQWTNQPLRKIIHELHGGRVARDETDDEPHGPPPAAGAAPPSAAATRTHHRGRPGRRGGRWRKW